MEVVESRLIGEWTAVKINLQNAPLLVVVAKKGYVMCGYLNFETAEKLGDACCMVTKVRSFEEMFSAKVVKASTAAKKFGVYEGMVCEEALKLLS